MVTSATERRPPQVTFTGWLVVGGSVFVLLGAFEAMGALRTMETREMIQTFLDEPPGSSLGIGFERARELRRVAILVLGACAAAASILGFFVLRRDRAARVALTVLAVPLFLSGSIAGGFASAIVTVSIVMLWLEPARSWFAGRAVPERFRPRDERPSRDDRAERRDEHASAYLPPHEPGRPSGPPAPPASSPEAPADAPTQQPWGRPDQPQQHPQPYHGFGTPQATQTTQQRPQAPEPYAQPYGTYGQRPQRGPRPGRVVAACVVTWVATGILAALAALSLLALVLWSDDVLDQLYAADPTLRDQAEVSDGALTGTLAFMMVVLLVWCISAAVFAFFTLRGAGWARILLLISAGAAALFSLLGAWAAPPMLLFGVAAGFTFVSLVRRDVARWFGSRGQMGP